MFFLEFKNSCGQRRKIAEINLTNKEECMKCAMEHIHAFCEERNFRIYYTRTWETPTGEICFDVGSHTEFFYLKQVGDSLC